MGDIIEFNLEDFQFCWDYRRDQAVCKISGTDSPFWRGSLLPSFHVFCGKETSADSLAREAIEENPGRWKIPLSLGLLGSGSIVCEICIWGIRFQNLEVRWAEDTAIIGLYFGIKQLTQTHRS